MTVVRENFVASAGSVTNTDSATMPNCAAGDCLLAHICWGSATTTLDSVTVDDGGTVNLTLLGSVLSAGFNDVKSRWAVLGSVTNSGQRIVTANFSASQASASISLWRLSGHDTATPIDGTASSATGSSTTPSVSYSTSSANSAIFAFITAQNSSFTPGTGYTGTDDPTNTYWYDHAEYDLDVESPGSKTVDGTLGGSVPWAIHAVAVKSAGGSTAKPHYYYAQL